MLLRVLLLSSLPSILAVNFPFEEVQLTDADISSNSDVQFGGNNSEAAIEGCKYIPGDDEWPTEAEWARLNDTLGGALLKPKPLASVCYAGPDYDARKCSTLQRTWTSAALHANDPISIMSQWPSGHSCVPTSNPNSTCTQGGWPVYVVNATTVRHIQAGVNFARNRNIRLVIKNSGHDFSGRSIGGHSLSIWVHNLKDFAYHPTYTASNYTGRAVSYAGGYQAQDAQVEMARHNMTFIVAGGPTVGIAGGFLQSGGHSGYTSFYGMAADRVLSLQAVTADGRLVTASADENEDLFWAFRGGGAGTYGIITSVVVQAFPNLPRASGSIQFSTVASGNTPGVDVETFWRGVQANWAYGPAICSEGGLGYNFIRHTPSGNGTSGYTFQTSISLNNRTAPQYRTFIRPLLLELRALGIPVPLPSNLTIRSTLSPSPPPFSPPSLTPRTPSDTTTNTLIASRLFQLSNHAPGAPLTAMSNSIRHLVETSGGAYEFHGMHYSPTLAAAGHPSNAVHPAFRTTIMHAQAYRPDEWWDGTSPVGTWDARTQRHERLQRYLQTWRDITPGSGSYMNEGDITGEPDPVGAFYGGEERYERLRGVKRRWDPRGVFWTVRGVGSEGWEVRGEDEEGEDGGLGVRRQDGRLCLKGAD
ncbi:FAD-binding domain-containing protein [Aaosphaeria arxii CBS 175.79]|uniref:FAD-binding domain-containing protein n=1 Tax=Aaosphaeria arxii CBS 175.79 TaxID=1450172 RepID=A0A6A5XC31_9PLEO|nr:FAD-binding domain-containing protein [Aaosphaeria arxii CBS 175.79]KAF2010367.1 FAD-binding domain-containing protein [Aaosphaeria arxii CBS 175.79]